MTWRMHGRHSAILVYLNNEKPAILVYQINPVEDELYLNANSVVVVVVVVVVVFFFFR